MPKSMYVKPEDKFAKRTITFKDIPVCEYDKTVKDEKKNFSKEDFLGMYADMVAIREFETMLQSIKLQGEYNGKKFTYPAPPILQSVRSNRSRTPTPSTSTTSSSVPTEATMRLSQRVFRP